jgi:hypothetical protein
MKKCMSVIDTHPLAKDALKMNVAETSRKSLVSIALTSLAFVACGASGAASTGTGGTSGQETGGSAAVGSSGSDTGGSDTTSLGGAGGSTTSSTANKNTGGGKATGGASPTGGTPGTGGTPACHAALASTGCTAVTPSQTGSLAGQYGTATVTAGGKQYFLQVNEWGSNASQNLSYGGNVFFKMTQQSANVSTSGAPAGYPSAFIGSNNGHSTSGSGMPKAVSSLGTVLTTWNWSDNGAIADTASNFNAAYDVWFSTNASGDSKGPSGGYLMVWYYAKGCQPVGALQDAGHLIDGLPGCWNVWVGTNSNDGKPVISYQHQGALMSFGFDLNLFIKDAAKNYPGYMSNSWYLTNIFTGFEIWSGGSALQSTSFCAEVN